MNKHQIPRVAAVDLFCGVGGLTHGLERAGIDVRLGVDIDAACRLPFEANNGARFLQADVAELEVATLAEAVGDASIVLLAGCAPCQPFSTYARSAKGTRDGSKRGRGKAEDWTLVRRFGELIREMRPHLVTMENVPPLKDEPVFRELLDALEGYSVDVRSVQCRTIGLPQTRTRLVLVASLLGPITLPEFSRPMVTVRDTIAGLPPLSAGGIDPEDPLHRASKLSDRNLQRIRASKPGGTWRDWPADLRADCHRQLTGATYPSVYGRMEWDAPAPTVTTQCFGYGNGRFGHPEQDRAISLREAAMLQGFPYNYVFAHQGDPVSFATLGRLIGNAVPVMLAEVIGELLLEHVGRIH